MKDYRGEHRDNVKKCKERTAAPDDADRSRSLHFGRDDNFMMVIGRAEPAPRSVISSVAKRLSLCAVERSAAALVGLMVKRSLHFEDRFAAYLLRVSLLYEGKARLLLCLLAAALRYRARCASVGPGFGLHL